MAYQIIINVEDEEDITTALQEVSNLYESGYHGGILGCSGDTWEINEV